MPRYASPNPSPGQVLAAYQTQSILPESTHRKTLVSDLKNLDLLRHLAKVRPLTVMSHF